MSATDDWIAEATSIFPARVVICVSRFDATGMKSDTIDRYSFTSLEYVPTILVE